MSRFRMKAEHTILGTDYKVRASGFTQLDLERLRATAGDEEAGLTILAERLEDVSTGEQAWKDGAAMKAELSPAQIEDLFLAVGRLTHPERAERLFRGSAGDVAGAGPAPDGEGVRTAAIGATPGPGC